MNGDQGRREPEAVYPYVDERDEPLFEVCRFPGKRFLQRRPDGSWGLDDTRRVLFRLPRLVQHLADNRIDPIYVVEGEKDVLAIEEAGGTATCNPMGAGKWTDDYSELLQGARRVVVVADRDEIGREHAGAVAASLAKVGVAAEVVEPFEGKDASDHLAAGYYLGDFVPADPTPAIADPEEEHRGRLVRGDAFVLDLPDDMPAVWGGASGTVAWAEGEPLMLVGPDGVGKTTLGQQLALGRIGLRRRVLGMVVADDGRPVLYLALDRPAQAARSFARMVDEKDRAALHERLIVWRGPLPFDVLRELGALADFAERQEAGTVVIDSLKDVAAKLSDDEVGSRVNMALQEVVARGVQVLVLHHQRKQQQGAGPPRRISDVFGSRWLTAGMGSVFCLWGEAGDLVVEMAHLKQPLEALGPWKLLHDHEAGETRLIEQVDLLGLVASTSGLTVEAAAAALFDTGTPDRNQIEKARRRLEKLFSAKLIEKRGEKPNPVTYHPREAA